MAQQEADVFLKFDVVSDASDHYFFKSFNNISNKVHKKIMQEWKILEKDLPDSIYVRVYENRIDLLRAVIIGAAGTPYHDGLYFFDIAFPFDYPLKPPLLYYNSFGLRINPNLYSSGRVCLSLVNTWYGKKIEKWNPNESTLLQVLLSIQALVLNEKPYYNEPGHNMRPGRVIVEKKSNLYSEDVFVLACKTMLFNLRRPPKNFEGFVRSHFRERASIILSACNAYVNGGIRIGYYNYSGSGIATTEVSCDFKAKVAQLYPQMASAFINSGASLESSRRILTVEVKTAPFKEPVVMAKKKSGIVTRVFGKLKKVLGLKEKSGKNSVVKKTT
ncbi:putative ubiquitin-conjugating enzyme E2 38 [Mercurialis annua]|uniref:putative ubiquitin-conjugating enzyme E2 38 n=1 Tax=Mercurialis annua TaxID=3986 RepID=UPI002160C798|nr:putative ubiquitin-conjugating enzyme E2 38 [Mercurialis annua]